MRRLTLLGLVFLLLTAPVAAQSSSAGRADQLYAQGRTLTKQKRYTEALPLLQQASQINPRSFATRYELGWTFEHLNQPQKALVEYKAALELCPQEKGQSLSDTLQSLSAIYAKLGNKSESIALLERAATVEPEVGSIQYNLGIEYQTAGNNQKAVEHLVKALQIKPDDAGAMRALSDSYLDLGQDTQAIEWAQKAVKLQPDSSQAHYKLAYAFRHTGDSQKACAEYQQALRLKPNDSEVIRAVANCYSDQGMKKEAVEWYQKYLKANPRASDYKKTSDLIADLLAECKKQPIADDPQGPDYFLSAVAGEPPRRWPAGKLPLKVYIDLGAGGAAMQDSNVKVFAQSLDDWMAASQGRLSYQLVPTAEQADLLCSWTSNPTEVTSEGTDYHAGSTRTTEVDRAGGVEIEKARIRILTVEKQSKPVDEAKLKGTCLHEIGHALGLKHSPNSQDVMYFQDRPRGVSALSNRDKATLLKFYSQYPVR